MCRVRLWGKCPSGDDDAFHFRVSMSFQSNIFWMRQTCRNAHNKDREENLCPYLSVWHGDCSLDNPEYRESPCDECNDRLMDADWGPLKTIAQKIRSLGIDVPNNQVIQRGFQRSNVSLQARSQQPPRAASPDINTAMASASLLPSRSPTRIHVMLPNAVLTATHPDTADPTPERAEAGTPSPRQSINNPLPLAASYAESPLTFAEALGAGLHGATLMADKRRLMEENAVLEENLGRYMMEYADLSARTEGAPENSSRRGELGELKKVKTKLEKAEGKYTVLQGFWKKQKIEQEDVIKVLKDRIVWYAEKNEELYALVPRSTPSTPTSSQKRKRSSEDEEAS